MNNTRRNRTVGTGASVLAGLMLWSGALPLRADENDARPKQRPTNTALLDLQEAFAAIADDVEPAVVTVLSTKARKQGEEEAAFPSFLRRPRRSTGTGSGVIISKDGWVLTNDHVVGGADRVTVRLNDGREFVGTVRRDYRSDLALVKIDSELPFPVAKLGDSDKVKIGHWAVAIGSPYRYEGSFSVGVISSLQRKQDIFDASSPNGGRFYPTLLQTDAAINPGNSGGPLLNINGEVIGINTAIESDGGGSIGIGFAIPINSAKFVVKQLLDKGKVSYGYLGVSPTSVTPRLASSLKVERGALIDRDPEADSPAAKAGLQAGDVVVQISGKPVKNELDLRTIVAQTLPGTAIEMKIVRDGVPKSLTAKLEEARSVEPETARPNAKGKFGVEVQPITEQTVKELPRVLRVPTTTPGVLVKTIDPASSASDIDDLVEGAVILKINDTETKTVQAFQAATAKIKSGDQVRVYYQVGKVKKFAVVSVD
jgi:serine protease Do